MNRYDLLPIKQSKSQTIATYVWIDSTGELIRTKSRTIDYEPKSAADLVWWDAPEALSTAYINTDVHLKPVRIYNDPFFSSCTNYLVLCETLKYDRTKTGIRIFKFSNKI
jgi:glutamine synthetase